MVKLRLARFGSKKHAFYRIIAADSRKARDSRWLEQLGTFDPNKDPGELKIDLARVDYWIGVGAQASDTVGSLIARARKDAAAVA